GEGAASRRRVPARRPSGPRRAARLMPRYRLTLEYDGGPYRGFQAQGDLPSVQGALEAAILAFSSEAARVHVSGRTDTGVHATGQVVHFEVERTWRTDVIRDDLNAYLRERSIVVI